MFDVRPVKESGGLDFEKALQVKTEVNLRKEPPVPQPVKPYLVERPIVYVEAPVVKKETLPTKEETKKAERRKAGKLATPEGKIADSKHSALQEFEQILIEPVNPTIELARFGAQVHPFVKQEPRPRFVARIKMVVPAGRAATLTPVPLEAAPPKAHPVPFVFNEARPQPRRGNLPLTESTPASNEMDFWLARQNFSSKNLGGQARLSLASVSQTAMPRVIRRPVFRLFPAFRLKSWLSIFLVSFGLLGLGWWAVRSGVGARDNIIQNGSNAVANLEEAKQKLENLEFSDAANSFALAYDDLNKASGTLDELGASFLSVFGNLPGLGKINAANNLVEAGRNLSKAGENLASALGTLYNSNPFSLLGVGAAGSTGSPQAGSGSGAGSLSGLLGDFRAILVNADRNIKKAGSLLADIDNSVIPEDKRPLLLNFKEKIPQFQEYIGNAISYSDFLLKFVGSGGEKKYLVLLQNNSELRPTGGFPGTYALMTFKDGNLEKIFVDDIYQIDSNLKENIVPPLQMQHITPTWGMRDANWFADFPTSARKVEEFYKKDSGGTVDGVLALTPDVIAKVFEVIGPIDMPEYGLTLDAGNFLAEIQNEVEYEADRAAPKKILTDLEPKFFEKLGGEDKNGWIEIFKILLKAAEEKHILAYFNDSDLQKMAVENGLGGEVKKTPGDFLEVVFANVKGSKTDFVTDNSFNLDVSQAGDGSIEHTLTINRAHNGGDSEYGFYNRDNSAYVEIFVPEDAVIESVIGQSITDFRPLINHEDFGFKKDPDLERIESGITHPVAGVDVFEESGRTVFGFWLIVKPKQTKSVVLKYRLPGSSADNKYHLLWQKQSGTGEDLMNFSFKLPDGASVANLNPGLQQLGNNLILNSDLSVDRTIDIKLR